MENTGICDIAFKRKHEIMQQLDNHYTYQPHQQNPPYSVTQQIKTKRRIGTI